MINQIDFYYPFENNIVTDKYFSIVFSAFKKLGITYKKLEKLEEKESDYIFVSSVKDSVKAKKAGYKKVFLWIQGIIPEESFLRNHSYLKKIVLSHIEKNGIKTADFVFYVSTSMKNHIEKKYHLKTDNYYIMPCFNDELHEDSFYTKEKYKNNVFLYAGSLDAWQCFRETAALYSKIEKQVNNCSFRILTKDADVARSILKEHGIKNYSIGFVSPDKIGEEMKRAKFGFSIRKEDPVNRVATPTKLSTYVAYGLMPIYSDCLKGFHEISKGNPYCLCINPENSDISKIIDACSINFDPEDVFSKMEKSFGEYYSSSFHIDHIAEVLAKII